MTSEKHRKQQPPDAVQSSTTPSRLTWPRLLQMLVNFIRPLIRRSGTAFAASLATYMITLGADPELANQITAVLLALALVALDLYQSYKDRN
jgi:hypothetical protein